MAHAAEYGMTRIKVTLDSADSSDWVANNKYRIISYAFAPYSSTPGESLFLGELQGDDSIIGMPLTSPSGGPVGATWDTRDTEVTPAIDMSESVISGETVVIINIGRSD